MYRAPERWQYHQDRNSFLPGARVWLFTPQTATGEIRKLSRYWSGPWVVCAQPVNDVMVRIKPHPSWQEGPSRVVSIDRLKLYKTRTRAFPYVEGLGDVPAEEYLVGSESCRTAGVSPQGEESGGERVFP